MYDILFEDICFISPTSEFLTNFVKNNIKNIEEKTIIEKQIYKVNKKIKKPFSFTIKVLSNDNLCDLMNLQNVILKKLDVEGHGGFVIKKTEDDFKKLTDNINGITVGIFDNTNGKLVGKTSIKLKNLKGLSCDVANGIKTTNYIPATLDCSKIDYAFEITGTMVHPDYNGMNLSKDLGVFLEDIIKAKMQSNVLLLEEIATTNVINIHVANSSGFKALQIYTASDGIECYLYYKPINKKLEILTGFDKVDSIVNEKSKTISN